MGVPAAVVALVSASVSAFVASEVTKPKTPNPPAAPENTDPEVAAVDAASKQRRRTRAMGNRSNTVLTGPQGAATGTTYQGETLLGK